MKLLGTTVSRLLVVSPDELRAGSVVGRLQLLIAEAEEVSPGSGRDHGHR